MHKLHEFAQSQKAVSRNGRQVAAQAIAALATTRMKLEQDSRIQSVIASAPTLWEAPANQTGGSLLAYAREAIAENLVDVASNEIIVCRLASEFPAGELEAEVLPLTWERCADHLREYAGRYAEEKHGEQDDVYRAAVKLANHTIVTLNVRDPIRLQGLFDSDPTLWGEQADIGIRPLTALAGNIRLADWMAEAVMGRLIPIASRVITGEQRSEAEAAGAESSPAP